jgi:heme-degrading monooxygenase HmoA
MERHTEHPRVLRAVGVERIELSVDVRKSRRLRMSLPSHGDSGRGRAMVQAKGDPAMVAVIFEVWPSEGRRQEYLDLAAALRPRLEQIDGFISVERFESLYEPGKILSLSFFRDEDAVARWRSVEEHRAAQAKGRGGIFRDYRLRVAGVIRDYGRFDRAEVPDDSRVAHG